MYKKLLKKPLSFLLSFSLLLQNFTPLLVLPVYAEDSTTSAETTPVIPSEVEESPSITPTPSPEPTPEVTPETTPTPTEEVSPTPTVEPTPDTTPTPTEVITPVPTPEITPEITVTPEPTPTTAPEVTPAPTSNGDAQAPPQESNQSNDSTAVIPTDLPADAAPQALQAGVEESPSIPTESTTVPESITIAAQIENQESSPTLSTDKADYFPTEIVHISGTGFDPNTTYTLHTISSDSPFVSFYVDITADENGNLKYDYQLDGHFRPNYSIEAINLNGIVIATYSFTDASADLDQCANGSISSPDTTPCQSDTEWENGNLGASKSHYYEGDTIPYRMLLNGLSLESHTVTIEWDTTKNDKHSIDYITSFDNTVPADPCAGVGGCSSYNDFLIPSDSQVTGAGVSPISGSIRLFGGTITSISGYSYPNGPGFVGDKSARITITFTASQTNPVLAWGGHIATRDDWGSDMAATAISGSPYHMRLIDLDGKGGNQDKSLSAEAVIFPASITIIKDATPNGPTSFPYTASPSPLSNFSLIDDGTSTNTKVFSDITNFTTYSISENSLAGWTLTGIVCSVTSANGGSQTVNGSNVSVDIKEGENVICTYSNQLQSAHLIVIKHVVNDDGGTSNASDFTMTVNNVTAEGGNSFAGSEAPGADKVVSAGSYSVSETGPAGYSASYSADCTSTISAGQTKTCTVTNNDNPAHLIVIKQVDNGTSGSTAVSGDFTMTINGVTASGGNSFPGVDNTGTNKTLTTVGNYSVSETGPAGYSASYSADCNGTIGLGETKTCTVINTANTPKLKVVKVVDNGNTGATFTSGNFQMKVDGNNVTQNVSSSYSIGDHSITETGPTGYTASYSSDCPNGVVNLALGDDKTCTITNTAIAPTLTITKSVSNLNGGIKVASDFQGKIDGNNVAWSTPLVTTIGPHAVSEVTLPGYTASVWSTDCTANGSVTLSLGENKTCSITNSDQPAQLTVTKVLNKQYNGSLTCADFSFTVNGGTSTPFEADCSNTMSVNAGTYSVLEDAEAGYTPAYTNCTNVVLANGGSATCTIRNDDQPATLVVKKVVINDNGGTKVAQDFTFKVNGGSNVQFVGTGLNGEVTLAPLSNGSYSIVENSDSQYTTTYDNCSVNIANGETKTCTITNNDKPSSLTLVKTVTNDNGGTLSSSNFPVYIGVAPAVWGSNSVNAGSYLVSETSQPGYTPSVWSGDCAANGSVTILPGDRKTCTITNDDIPARLKVIKVVDNGNTGASFTSSDFQMIVDGGNVSQNEFFNVLPGIHTITESGPSGYSTGFSDSCSGGSITLALGEEKTCTVTNTATAPMLTLVKTVTNNNGGTKTASDFQAYIDSIAVLWSGAKTLTVGSHTASEDSVAGYTASDWGGDCAANGSITLALGENKTCTVTNDDQAGTLIVRKVVLGSNTLPSNFSFSVNSGAPVDFEVDGQNNISVNAGVYTVSETPDENYSTTYENCSRLDIGIGETETCTITNTKYGSISGYKYEDENGNGTKDEEDAYLNGWTIKLYDGNMTELAQSITGSTGLNIGQFKFTNLLPGSYTVCEVDQDGWYQTDPGTACRNINLSAGSNRSGNLFGNVHTPSITLVKSVINDNGGEAGENDFGLTIGGVPVNSGEPKSLSVNTPYAINEANLDGYSFKSISGDGCPEALGGTVTLTSGDNIICTIINDDKPGHLIVNKITDPTSDTTTEFSISASGTSEVDNPTRPIFGGSFVDYEVNAGTYSINEEVPTGWYISSNECVDITVGNGETKECTITNTKMGKITFTKETNLEEDETVFEFETNFTEGNVRLSNGDKSESGYLQPGTYSITELDKSGWTLTGATCSDESDPSSIELSSGEEVTCTFRNEFAEPEITISKFNDATTDKTPGSSVIFRILVKVTGSKINELFVKDLLPQGFTYRPGSAQINGVTLSSGDEPQYHSPGIWNVGSVNAGDEVELLYVADISSSQLPGTYFDSVWAKGKSLTEDPIMATADEGAIDTNFAGTKVSVVKDQSRSEDYNVEKKEEVKGQVLGASTSLPATGARDIWLLISLCSIFLGIKLVRSSKQK